MIRGIIFDCFGVLYQGSLAHQFELTPVERHTELADLSKQSDYGYISHDDYVAQVSCLTGKSPDEIESIMHADHIRNNELITYVRTLRSQYKLAMLSNVGRGVMDRLFSREELAELFDVVVLSSEVGMVKPNADIFQMTSDKLGILPENCLMVDDLHVNIDGAIQAGMHGVVFTTTEKFISDTKAILAK